MHRPPRPLRSDPVPPALGCGLLFLALLHSRTARGADGPPWIGLELAPGRSGGVAVQRVIEGSPGERARLRPGDEVLSIDGQRVAAPAELTRLVRTRPSRALVRLQLAAPAREVSVQLEPRPDPVELQRRALLGKPAPEIDLAVKVGPKVASLSALRGRVVLLDFFATWCRPCIAALPRLSALHRELSPRGLSIVGLTDESDEAIGELRAAGVEYTLALDGRHQAHSRYLVSALPTVVVLDRQGVVREIAIADQEQAERAVRALLAAPVAGPTGAR
jgi:thiol-disulfide isomerase/thioredoxin